MYKTDGNQKEVVGILREHNLSVLSLASVGRGCPDLLIGLPDGRNVLIELKDRRGRGARFTDHENRFLNTWQGECHVCFNADDALRVLGLKEGTDERTGS